MSALFTQLVGLATELVEMYPNDVDVSLGLTTIQLLKSTNPAMLLKFVYDNLVPFEDKIMAKNESFFVDYSYTEYGEYVDMSIFSKLKQYHSTMSEESKEMTWKYVHNILKLSKACH
jgi:hypothetical protein